MTAYIGIEHSGSVVECLTPDRGTAGSSPTGVTAFCPLARHINPSLVHVLVQPRKNRPNLYITERLLVGCKESNQTNNAETSLGLNLEGPIIATGPGNFCDFFRDCL